MAASLTVEGLVIPADVHTLEGFRSWAAGLGEDGPRVPFHRARCTSRCPLRTCGCICPS